jgi:uncharacterized protein (DUF1697 family)
MAKWIALFRGINVGGKNILSMTELVSNLTALKLQNIRTYIQSGNVIFDCDSRNAKELSISITEQIQRQHGFAPQVLIVSAKNLELAIKRNPFPEAVSDPKSLHFFFLEKSPTTPNLKALDNAKSSTESYKILENVFYLHAPDGVGRSKLAASAERLLGVAATARNYRTVAKLAAIAAQT